jgi:hypothetical protein
MKRGKTKPSQPFRWLICLAIGFSVTSLIVLISRHKGTSSSLEKQPYEVHVIGMGIDDFVTLPPQGESFQSFFTRFRAPSGTHTVQLIGDTDDAYIEGVSVGFDPDLLDLRSIKELRITPEMEVWLFNSHGMPFSPTTVYDLRTEVPR